MNHQTDNALILAVFPSVRGFGFALWDGAGGRELAVLDLTTPLAPSVLGSVAVPADCRQVVPNVDRVLLASDSAGVTMVDITSPAAPVGRRNRALRPTRPARTTGPVILSSTRRRKARLRPTPLTEL